MVGDIDAQLVATQALPAYEFPIPVEGSHDEDGGPVDEVGHAKII